MDVKLENMNGKLESMDVKLGAILQTLQAQGEQFERLIKAVEELK